MVKLSGFSHFSEISFSILIWQRGHFIFKSSIFDIFFENLSFDFPEKKYETRIIMILDFSFLLPCQGKF